MENEFRKIMFEKMKEVTSKYITESWEFTAKISLEKMNIVLFSLSHEKEECDDYIWFDGILEVGEKIKVIELKITQGIYKKDKLEYQIEMNLSKSEIRQFKATIDKLLSNSRMYKYFLQDYQRYNKEDPFENIKQIIKENEFSFEIKELPYEGTTYVGTSPYLEEVIELYIQSDDLIEELEDDYFPDVLCIKFEDILTITYEEEESDYIRELATFTEEKIIHADELLVRLSTPKCIYKNHKLENVEALIYIDTDKEIIEKRANAFYCSECQQYYITEREFQKLKSYGRICCKIIEIEEYKNNNIHEDGWQKKSLLRSYGYSVNAQINLSSRQRHRILSFLIENNILEKERIIDYIEWFIRRNSSSNMEVARGKWEEDLEYLYDYEPATKIIIPKTIQHKNYI